MASNTINVVVGQWISVSACSGLFSLDVNSPLDDSNSMDITIGLGVLGKLR